MTSIGVKIICPENLLPQYAHPTDAGCDLRYSGVESLSIPRGGWRLVETGVKLAIPERDEAQMRSRSGNAAKRGLFVLNSPGTIDSQYRGEVKVLLANFSETEQVIHPGDRVAQLVFAPVAHAVFESVKALDYTQRGSGGFGSTGTK